MRNCRNYRVEVAMILLYGAPSLRESMGHGAPLGRKNTGRFSGSTHGASLRETRRPVDRFERQRRLHQDFSADSTQKPAPSHLACQPLGATRGCGRTGLCSSPVSGRRRDRVVRICTAAGWMAAGFGGAAAPRVSSTALAQSLYHHCPYFRQSS
jgi:hypothetical protein